MFSLIDTSPLWFGSAAGQADAGMMLSAMFTPRINSSIVTTPLPLQSPTQTTTVAVGDGSVLDVAEDIGVTVPDGGGSVGDAGAATVADDGAVAVGGGAVTVDDGGALLVADACALLVADACAPAVVVGSALTVAEGCAVLVAEAPAVTVADASTRAVGDAAAVAVADPGGAVLVGDDVVGDSAVATRVGVPLGVS